MLFISCKRENKQEEVPTESEANVLELTAKQIENAHVKLGKLESKKLHSKIISNGKLISPAKNKLSVCMAYAGYLTKMNLFVGKSVKKGQVLAEIEAPHYVQLQEDYLVAKVQLGMLQKEYVRQKELNSTQASSNKAFEQAETAYRTQQIAAKSLEEKLKILGLNPQNLSVDNISKTISLRASSDGFVTKINANPGSYFNPEDVLFELITANSSYLSLSVFEKDLDRISEGVLVMAYTNNNTQKKYSGKVFSINKTLSDQGVAEVLCELQNSNELTPGTFMNAEIESGYDNAFVLPEQAVVFYEGKHYIFENQGNNQFKMIEIQIGSTSDGKIQIINGQQLIDKEFAVEGAYDLLMALNNSDEE
ncbi:MAG: efflux RND transporter periplasmic adaptor subunit [Flavobacteriales bacterium]|nr:efflux RND transporter periplasmic adaptor subunit [Flavobacteriales bacterium]